MDESQLTSRRRWIALAVLCVSLIVIALDATIVNVAAPTISMKLHTSENQLQWVIDAYTLVFAVLLLTCGHSADRVGRKVGLIVGLVVFGFASLLAALSTKPSALIALRALMGLGAAFIMPATLSSISHMFRDQHERTKALSIWSATLGIGAVLGPIIGGKLLQVYNWESVFWVNVPIVVVGIVLAIPFVPNSKHPGDRADLVALLVSAIALGTLVWAIIEGPVNGWSSHRIILAFVLSGVSLVAFVIWELKVHHPLLPMHFFKNLRFSMASLSISTAYFGLMGALFLSTQYIQFVLDNDPFHTGVKLLPEALAIAGSAVVAGRLVHRVGTKFVVTVGLLIMSVSLLMMAQTTKDWTYTNILPALIGLGAGIGTTMAPCEESVIDSLPQAQMGTGTAVNSTLIQVGSTLGVAVFGSLENTAFLNHMSTYVQALPLPSDIRSQMETSIYEANAISQKMGVTYASEVRTVADKAFVHGFDHAMLVGCCAAFVAAIVALGLLPSRRFVPLRHHKITREVEM
ncbi:MAG: MFS transporter [Alicyclobacillus sp.]|nr:MFS transporter [Alicyclobacillus sp.]